MPSRLFGRIPGRILSCSCVILAELARRRQCVLGTMTNLQTILLEYFMVARSTLDVDYVWNIPEKLPIPFTRGTDSHARANMRLRRELRNAWITEPTRRYELAVWYIRDWGRIRRNDDETLQAYCNSSEEKLASLSWKGVATWSKILAMPPSFARFARSWIWGAWTCMPLTKTTSAQLKSGRSPA